MSGSKWTPARTDYEEVIRESFARQTLMQSLGARVTTVAPGVVHVSAPWSEAFTQQNGFWHGGVVASIADTANGYAAFTLAPPGHDVLAVEFKVNLMAPARGDSFEARGAVLRPGKTLTVCQADVFALSADGETLIATMLSTLIIRPIPPAR